MPPVAFACETNPYFPDLRRALMSSNRANRWTIAAMAIAGFALTALPGELRAQTPDHPADTATSFPNRNDLKSLTGAGSYLAARHASVERDASSAAAFYRSALRMT
jgi:hypothetical protein